MSTKKLALALAAIMVATAPALAGYFDSLTGGKRSHMYLCHRESSMYSCDSSCQILDDDITYSFKIDVPNRTLAVKHTGTAVKRPEINFFSGCDIADSENWSCSRKEKALFEGRENERKTRSIDGAVWQTYTTTALGDTSDPLVSFYCFK